MPRIAAPTRVFQGVLRPFRLNFLGADLLLKARLLWDCSSVARSQDPFICICSDVRITGLDSGASLQGREGALLLFPQSSMKRPSFPETLLARSLCVSHPRC